MKKTRTLALGAAIKNERPYLLEWLAHHSLLGFDRFYIIDDNSSDGSYELLRSLRRKMSLRVERRNDKKQKNIQEVRSYANYRRILSEATSDKVDYLAFVDLDEFIASPDPQSDFRTTLEALFEPHEVSAVGLNWCCFGSSGHFMKPPGLVLENFPRHGVKDRFVNHHYKSIIRPERVFDLWNTHQFKLKEGNYVHSDGRPLKPHPEHPYGISQKVCWDRFRVNHYVVKSVEEFICFKARRGCGETYGKVKGEDYFRRHDQNEIEEPFPPSNIEPIKNLIRQWGFDPDEDMSRPGVKKWWKKIIS